jgi:hypothetical protein
MEHCVHTNLTKPECSCQGCLLELLAEHAPELLGDRAATGQAAAADVPRA